MQDQATESGLDSQNELISAGTREKPSHSASGVRARVKVLNPMTSIGPSMEAELLSCTDSDLQIRVPRMILDGSAVQVLTPKGVVFGKVWLSLPVGKGFEIEVAVIP
jgi:hypothetical protein